jgi:hypothetical protein
MEKSKKEIEDYKGIVRFIVESESPFYTRNELLRKETKRVEEICKEHGIDEKSCNILIQEVKRKIEEIEEEREKEWKSKTEVFF